MANTIQVELDLDTLKATGKLSKFKNTATTAGKKAGDSFGSGFSSGFTQILAGTLGADLFRTALRGITGEIGNVVSAAKSLEIIKTQFKTLLGSTQAAEKQLRDLQAFAAKTPFEIEGLALSTRQLISFGVENEKIIPTLGRLGDIASGVGADISDLTIPFGRLISTQKLTLIELDKFQDKGINIFGELSKQTGISMANIRKAITDGTIPFSEFDKALTSLTSEGGKFFKGMEAQSKTLDGALSNLSDTLFNTRGSFGATFSPIIITVVNKLSNELDKLSGSIASIDTQALSKQFIAFNNAVITYVISPLELISNVVSLVSASFNNGFATMVASVGFLGGKVAEFLEFMKIDAPEGLKTFADSSAEVLAETGLATEEALNKLFDFPVSAKMSVVNDELSSSLDEMNAMLAVKGKDIGSTLSVAITTPAKEAATTIQGAWNNLSIGLTNTSDVIKEQSKKTADIVKGSLVKGIAGGVQTLTNALINGEDAFKAFGNFILSTIGDLAIQLGTFFIAEGIAVEALNAVSGTGAIAAGAALVALGSLIKSFSGGGGAAATSSSGGSSTSIGQTVTDTGTFDEPDSFAGRQSQTVVNLNVQGVVSGDKTEVATFVQGILNEANEKNGIIQLNTRTA